MGRLSRVFHHKEALHEVEQKEEKVFTILPIHLMAHRERSQRPQSTPWFWPSLLTTLGLKTSHGGQRSASKHEAHGNVKRSTCTVLNFSHDLRVMLGRPFGRSTIPPRYVSGSAGITRIGNLNRRRAAQSASAPVPADGSSGSTGRLLLVP
jgi:hypothetical protein